MPSPIVAPITVPTGPAKVPAAAPPPAATTLVTKVADSFPASALVVDRVLLMMAPGSAQQMSSEC